MGAIRIKESNAPCVPPRYPRDQLLDQFVRVANLNADLSSRVLGPQALEKGRAPCICVKEMVLGERVFESEGSVRGAFDELLLGPNELVIKKLKVFVISTGPGVADS